MTCSTNDHAKLELPDKSRAKKVWDVYYSWDVSDLLKGCYQPSPDVILSIHVSYYIDNSLLFYFNQNALNFQKNASLLKDTIAMVKF